MSETFRKGQKTTVIAGGVTILFAALKAVIGFISGSIVLISDAVHSGADSFSTFFAWLGLKISQKKPTKKFPYGFYKAENITALIISGLILFAGYEIISESISQFFAEPQLNIPLWATGVAVLDALAMFIVGVYEVRTGKKINSQSLIADGSESKTHLFSSAVVLVGVISAWVGIPYLESITGMAIAILIFKIGIESGRDSIFSLMDVSPDKKTEKKIRRILNSISGIKAVEDLRLRRSGAFILGEVKVKVAKRVNVAIAQELSNKIESKVKEKVEGVDSLAVLVSPYEQKKHKICAPVVEDNGLDSKISASFGRASKFLFLSTEKENVKNYYIKDNIHKNAEVRVGLKVSQFIIKEKIDIVITKELGPISLHTLRDQLVDVYGVEEGDVKTNIKKFAKDKLQKLEKPTVSRT